MNRTAKTDDGMAFALAYLNMRALVDMLLQDTKPAEHLIADAYQYSERLFDEAVETRQS